MLHVLKGFNTHLRAVWLADPRHSTMDEVITVLKSYARRGLKDWNNATAFNKGLVSSALGNKIAASEWEADDTIEAVREDLNISRCRFIPMPNVNHGGMKYC